MKSTSLFTVIVAACCLLFAGAAQANMGGMRHHVMGEGCCAKDLPPEKARMVEGSMHQAMAQNKPLFERMRKLHERMRAIGTADKFDKKAFLAAGDEMASLHMKMEKNRMAMMAHVAGQLTASERRSMADCMEKNFHRGEFRHEGWDRGGGEHHGMEMNSHKSYDQFNQ